MLNKSSSPRSRRSSVIPEKNKSKLPTHLSIRADQFGIAKDSVVLLEQLRTIDKKRLREKVCHIDSENMKKVDYALKISLGLIDLST